MYTWPHNDQIIRQDIDPKHTDKATKESFHGQTVADV